MNNYQGLCIPIDAEIAAAARLLEQNLQKICLVVHDGILVGTVTDGDIRRGLLNGKAITDAVSDIMNREPRTISSDRPRSEVQKLMIDYQLRYIPVVSDAGVLTDLISDDELVRGEGRHDNWVVLMAGGLGERLRPLTEKTPKPLLQIGDKPLLQSILESFTKQHFHNFYISVNYQADAIKDHFGDGSAWGVNIRYLEEETRMGTAGALTLLPDTPTAPVIVMNGDLVTRTSFADLLDFHAEQNSSATMCVREYDFQVPFGVVVTEEQRIVSIDEKPVHRFFVNAGIYVLNPDIVPAIPKGERTDMTQIFERIVSEGRETAAFPIHEYWLDIGRIDDLERAQSDFVTGRNK